MDNYEDCICVTINSSDFNKTDFPPEWEMDKLFKVWADYIRDRVDSEALELIKRNEKDGVVE
jgi:hypothetical protein